MTFGGTFESAPDAFTEWIEQSCSGAWGTVGALVPNHFDSFVKVHSPEPSGGDWWAAYRDLFAAIVTVGSRHTSLPDHAYYAIWNGHGFLAPHQMPTLNLPHRTYYLTQAPLTATTKLRYPDTDGWRNPDLLWPEDHRWFIATDVDFWAVYVGGTSAFTTELASSIPTRTEPVLLTDALPTEL